LRVWKSFQDIEILEIDAEIPIGTDFAGFVNRNPRIITNLGDIAFGGTHNVYVGAVARGNSLGRHTVQPAIGMAIVGARFVNLVERYGYISAATFCSLKSRGKFSCASGSHSCLLSHHY